MRSEHGKLLAQRHFDEGLVSHLDIEISSDACDDFLLHPVEGGLGELGRRSNFEHFSEEGDDSIESDAALRRLVVPREVMLNLKQLPVLAVVVVLLH